MRRHAAHQRHDHWHAAVPDRVGRDADLRRSERHQLRARLALHDRGVRGVDLLPAHQQLFRLRAGGSRGGRRAGRPVRTRADEQGLRLQRADAAAGLLRRGADLRRSHQDHLGAGAALDGYAARVPAAADPLHGRRHPAILSLHDPGGDGDRAAALAGHRAHALRQHRAGRGHQRPDGARRSASA